MTTDVRAGFNEVINDAAGRGLSLEAVANEMGFGVGSSGGWWIQRVTAREYLAKQGKGLLGAPAVAALTMWLNSEIDGLGDFTSLGMIATDFLTTGDPLVCAIVRRRLDQPAEGARQ